MSENKWICWWNYKSFWKFFCCAILTVLLSFLCAYLSQSAWCIIGILPICFIGSYYMRKLLPDVFDDLVKELDDDIHSDLTINGGNY